MIRKTKDAISTYWQKMSINMKMQSISMLYILIIIIAFCLSEMLIRYSVEGFGDILSEDNKSQDFMISIINEKESLRNYISSSSEKNYENLMHSIEKTDSSIEKLPYNYKLYPLSRTY